MLTPLWGWNQGNILIATIQSQHCVLGSERWIAVRDQGRSREECPQKHKIPVLPQTQARSKITENNNIITLWTFFSQTSYRLLFDDWTSFHHVLKARLGWSLESANIMIAVIDVQVKIRRTIDLIWLDSTRLVLGSRAFWDWLHWFEWTCWFFCGSSRRQLHQTVDDWNTNLCPILCVCAVHPPDHTISLSV